ncbi:MAG: tRNA 2-selenouridine(34) synthase MnmH [Flavobacteriales bacterium]|nr:tRNA 2-selenouridine(34) synthase MnmH [Flavobacteriales bacterium]
MLHKVDVEAFWEFRRSGLVIDVRSPKEYRHGHIPSAINLPVFSDDERAVVGTLYKRKGKEAAIEKALAIVEPKREEMLEQVMRLADSGKQEVLIHCWRGGMRSERFGEFLSEGGLNVKLLQGGYKAYRNAIHEALQQPWKLIILGGMTGTGKTDILSELKSNGHQVICLEGIANHRGSAFGRLGQEGQPTTEQFQNNLWEAWSSLDIDKPVILEDESQAIGSVRIPDELFADMRKSPVINVQLDIEQRAERLVLEYGRFDTSLLQKCVMNIARRLGHERAEKAIRDLEEGNLMEVAISTLRYYDKAYTFGLDKREKDSILLAKVTTGDAKANADTVGEHVADLISTKWKK